MSSPRPVHSGSSPAGASGRRLSKFTYRHIAQLASYTTSCPLRIIAHVDLDAFYAQCEMVRLGVAEDTPLAVQQWQGLIAINYPARRFGIGRHCTVTDAKTKCPELVCQHVATWREGDGKWAYRPDAAEHIASDKVSLDPYRLESRKILAVIKNHLPPGLQKVEKASIDEVFLDLSAQVHAILLERYPELGNPPPYDDLTENLPMPPVTALDWQADALIDLEHEDAEIDDPDWDDVAMLIGSEVVRGIRAAVWEELHYTCSAGIATNKMLSKLGSGYKKPNQQTVIRTRARHQFLADFKFTKIRNLGGKLGEQVAEAFKTESIKDLLAVSMDQLKAKLGEETGVWLHDTIRGVDLSEVNARTQIKSMLSAKSFRPTINTVDQAVKWLQIFTADIFSRLVEEGVLENKRRPKTINLHNRYGGQTRSRQAPVPQGKQLDEETLFNLARNLLSQAIREGKVWPCANLSLSVGGFEDGITGNRGIDAFLVKGEEAQALKSLNRESIRELGSPRPAEKRRRLDNNLGIGQFFAKRAVSQGTDYRLGSHDTTAVDSGETWDAPENEEQADNEHCRCARCDSSFPNSEALQNHGDWHLARDLQQREERVASRFATSMSALQSRGIKATAATSAKKTGRPADRKLEPGQSKLKFG